MDLDKLSQRLASRVRPLGECLVWDGARTSAGYGLMGAGGKNRFIYTHRLAWELVHGPIPDGLFVCHRCDNPPCVNPDHLFIGDSAANVSDMMRKGRGRGQFKPGNRPGRWAKRDNEVKAQ